MNADTIVKDDVFTFRIIEDKKQRHIKIIVIEIGTSPLTLQVLQEINESMVQILDNNKNVIVVGYAVGKMDVQIGISESPKIRHSKEKYVGYLEHPNLIWMGITHESNIFLNVITRVVKFSNSKLKIYKDLETLMQASAEQDLISQLP